MNARVVAAIARKDIVDAIRNRYLLVALMTPVRGDLFVSWSLVQQPEQ